MRGHHRRVSRFKTLSSRTSGEEGREKERNGKPRVAQCATEELESPRRKHELFAPSLNRRASSSTWAVILLLVADQADILTGRSRLLCPCTGARSARRSEKTAPILPCAVRRRAAMRRRRERSGVTSVGRLPSETGGRPCFTKKCRCAVALAQRYTPGAPWRRSESTPDTPGRKKRKLVPSGCGVGFLHLPLESVLFRQRCGIFAAGSPVFLRRS